MKKVRITVLKTTLDKELAEEYGAAGLAACPMLEATDEKAAIEYVPVR